MSKKIKAVEVTTVRQLMSIVNKPLAERPMAKTENGTEDIRRHSLTTDKIKKLREGWEAAGSKMNRPPNPHNEGNYKYQVQALIDLGVNVAHSFAHCKEKIRELMGVSDTKDDAGNTAWQRFINKTPRNKDTGKNQNDRLIQNYDVLQRITYTPTSKNPYGYKLFQTGVEVLGSAGMVIDKLRKGDEIFYRLNTDSAIPLNEWKRQKAEKVEKAPKAPKVKAEKKVAKPKTPKVSKPKVKKPKVEKVSESQTEVADTQKESVAEPVTA